MARFGLFCFAVLVVLTSLGVGARVDIQIGFMEEEISFRLQDSLRRHPRALHIAIERNHRRGGIFGLPMSAFPGDVERSVHIVEPRARSLKGVDQGLPALLSAELDGVTPAFERTVLRGGSPAQTTERGDLKVHIFNPSEVAQDVLVFVQSPELGRQPELTEQYLRRIVAAVAALPQARWGVRLTSFGTAGSAHPQSLPGQVTSAAASLFIGVKRLGSRYQGQIELVGPGSQAQVFLTSEPFSDVAAAESRVKGWIQNVERFLLRFPRISTAVQEVQRTGRGVGLTLGYFGGDAEKKLAERLKLTSVAMEDAQVLRAVAPHVQDVQVLRIVSDPFQVSSEVVKSVFYWAKTARYTVSEYVEAILWGLQGSDLRHRPQRAEWEALKSVPAEVKERNFYSFGPSKAILDPFFAEIAAKFVEDAVEGKAISMDTISRKITAGLSPQARRELQELVDEKVETLRWRASDLMAEARGSQNKQTLRNLVTDLVLEIGELKVPGGTELHRELRDILNSGKRGALFKNHSGIALLGSESYPLVSGTDRVNIWVRAHKWGGGVSHRLNHMGPEFEGFWAGHGRSLESLFDASRSSQVEGFLNAVVHRSIYRSSLLPMSQEAAHRGWHRPRRGEHNTAGDSKILSKSKCVSALLSAR